MGRAPCCDKANVKKGPWSPEEDAKLKAYIEENGTGGNWIALPQKIGLKRCGKSCRLRWLNYLRPNIRHGDFSEQEDFIICRLYISIGSRWSIIAAQLQGRTDNDVKNYWNTKLKKKMLGRKKRESSQSRRVHDHTHEPSEKANGLNHDKTSLQSITSSALERRQLHMHLQSLYNPFSSRNSNPALWPEYHDTTPVPQQGLEDILPIEPTTYQTAYQVKSDMQTPMSTTIQEEEMDCSVLGFHSPSDSVCALSMDHSSSKTGLQAELHGVVDGKNECFGQEDYKLDGFCDYKQITNGEKESMDSWATNGFQEETSSSSWGPWDLSAILQADSVLQEYTQRWQRNEFLD